MDPAFDAGLRWGGSSLALDGHLLVVVLEALALRVLLRVLLHFLLRLVCRCFRDRTAAISESLLRNGKPNRKWSSARLQ